MVLLVPSERSVEEVHASEPDLVVADGKNPDEAQANAVDAPRAAGGENADLAARTGLSVA
jgi:hypothetical protein